MLCGSSDLQLAIALQRQEFEQQQQQGQQQQQQQQPQCDVPHPNTSRESGLVIGPQVGYAFSDVSLSLSFTYFTASPHSMA